jgi:hypothetical protein
MDPAREARLRSTGRVIVLALACLFVAMGFGIAGMAMPFTPAGEFCLALAKLFGGLWLPILGLGIWLRVTDADDAPPPDASSR